MHLSGAQWRTLYHKASDITTVFAQFTAKKFTRKAIKQFDYIGLMQIISFFF